MKRYFEKLLISLVLLILVSTLFSGASFVKADTGAVPVTVVLTTSTGEGISDAVVSYYAGGWQEFGTTSGGEASKELLPGKYTFRVAYANASNEKQQDIGKDPVVVFVTDKVDVAGNNRNAVNILTITVNGNGTTSPPAGEHSYPASTVVEISATADTGWQFVGWTGDVTDTGSANTTITMDSNKTIVANFELQSTGGSGYQSSGNGGLESVVDNLISRVNELQGIVGGFADTLV